MKTFEDVFSVLLHNYSSKKLILLVSPSFLVRDGIGCLYHLAKRLVGVGGLILMFFF
jgi:hypothetical protein